MFYISDVANEKQATPLSDISAVAMAIKKQLMEDSIVPLSVVTHEEFAIDTEN